MNRIALSDRLEGMSKVFAEENPIAQDLKAMAFALRNTTDEKFASVLNPEFEADVQSSEEVDAAGFGGQGWAPYQRGDNLPSTSGLSHGNKPISTEALAKAFEQMAKTKKQVTFGEILESLKGMVKAPMADPGVAPIKEGAEEIAVEASEDAGLFWTKEATEYITANLIKNVLGMDKSICCDTKRKLTPAQMPEGQHAGQKAPTLKPEQVPNQEYLDSKMVEKSHGAVKKEATEQEEELKMTPEELEKHEKGETKAEEAKEKKEDPKAEKAEDKKMEQAEKTEEIEANIFTAEGIELSGSMDEVDASSEEIQKLSALFN